MRRSFYQAPGHEFELQRPRHFDGVTQIGPPPSTQRSMRPKSVESSGAMEQLSEPWRSLAWAAQRKGNFTPIFGVVGTVAQLIRPTEDRTYLIVQNTSIANQLFVGVGYQPINNGTSVTGLILAANGGNFEPSVIPQQDIWLLGSGANTGFVLYVAQG